MGTYADRGAQPLLCPLWGRATGGSCITVQTATLWEAAGSLLLLLDRVSWPTVLVFGLPVVQLQTEKRSRKSSLMLIRSLVALSPHWNNCTVPAASEKPRTFWETHLTVVMVCLFIYRLFISFQRNPLVLFLFMGLLHRRIAFNFVVFVQWQ